MVRSFLAAVLASALATPATAQTSTTTTLPKARVLYTTAAVPNRVEGFCLGPNGGMALRPVFQEDAADNPRRLLIPNKPDGTLAGTDGDVLYVAGRHRVQSFQIGVNGGLEPIGTVQLENANPLDIAVNADRSHIYIPNRRSNRVEAYALNPDGGIIGDVNMTSCARVPNDVTLQDLEVGMSNGTEVLYVSEATNQSVAGKKGRIDIFQLTDGELPDLYNGADPDAALRCGNTTTTSTTLVPTTSSTSLTTLTTTVTTTSTSTTVDTRFTETLSTRKKMRGPGPFVLASKNVSGEYQFVYVYDIYARRVIEFDLPNHGLFEVDEEEQPRVAATGELGRFLDLIAFEGSGDPIERTLLGAADNQGRVRTFALKMDQNGEFTEVPKNPRLHQTNKIFDSTPVRITVGAMEDSSIVLYVPSGEANRIHAYRILSTKKGLFPEAKAFSSTEKRQATFPNDAAVAHIAGSCPCAPSAGTCP